MIITDPVGDLFTRIRNITMAGKSEVLVPHSSLKAAIAEVLKKEGYVSDVQRVRNYLKITLALSHRKPVITGIKNVSRPGLRIYRKANELPRPLAGAGVSIVSTPEGVMSGKEARKRKLGGEVLGEVW